MINTTPSRSLAMELVRVTEAAAISAAKYVGKGDKIGGDGAAVDAMRAVLSTIDIAGVVIIGEGEKDEAPMLFNGEKLGTGHGPVVDIAVDPVEGTTFLAYGQPNSISVIGVSDKGSMWDPGDSFYMNKIVVGHKAKHAIDITLSTEENLLNIAKALDKSIDDLTVFVLNKPRHIDLINKIKEVGARVVIQSDGDVMGALLAIIPDTCIDVLMGIGGTPEGVITACAVKSLNGGMQGMRCPQKEDEIKLLKSKKIDINEVLTLDTLVNSDNAFFSATGITDGSFLSGVKIDSSNENITTHSIAMHSATNTIRYIKGIHKVK
ncbi:MAG: class II fructose-bisphosphatase [Saprospiraceae bacterium]